MKISGLSSLIGCAIVASLGMTPLSIAAPPKLTTPNNPNFKSYSDYVSIMTYLPEGFVYLQAGSYDTLNGDPDGYVSFIYHGQNGDYLSLYCNGSTLANAVSVTPGGVARINSAISSSTPECFSYSYGNILLGTPVIINLFGQPDNSYSVVTESLYVSTYFGNTSKGTNKTYWFSDNYTGSITIPGVLNSIAPISGSASTSRNSNSIKP